MSKFVRSDTYEQKLFEQALMDEKRVIQDANIRIVYENGYRGKLKAFCEETETFLQFPTALREWDRRFIADVVEVMNDSVSQKYYRVVKGSIRLHGDDEIIA